jgi:cytochrome c5
MYLEIAVILLITVAGSVAVWNCTSFPKNQSDIKIAETATDSVEAPRTHAQNKNTEDLKNWKEGKDLFKSNCASCHSPKITEIGPAMMGTSKRWDDTGMFDGKPGKYWLYQWIRDWRKVVKAGHPYATEMSKWSIAEMNTFPLLSDGEIDKLLYFIEHPDIGNNESPKVITCYMPIY